MKKNYHFTKKNCNNQNCKRINDFINNFYSNNLPHISDEEQQLIEINKNKMQKLLDTQYTNKQHLDKLIITILFAEIGYLSHNAVQLVFPVIFSVIIGFIGILCAIKSYKLTTLTLQTEEQIKELEIYNLLKIDNYSGEIKELLNFNKKNTKKLDFYEWIVYYNTVTTSVITFEYLFFNKEIKNNVYYCKESINIIVITSALIILCILLVKLLIDKRKSI